MTQPNGNSPEQQRRQYVEAFNTTMVKIWKERISLLGVVDTGNLFRSVAALGYTADGKVTEVTLSQQFAYYGIYQDRGTGKEVPLGNGGDIHRDKKRQRRPWFSPKYYSSVMNLKDFFARSLADQCALVIATNLH